LDRWPVNLPYLNNILTNDISRQLTTLAGGTASVHPQEEQDEGEIDLVVRLYATFSGLSFVSIDTETDRRTEETIDTPPFSGLRIFSLGKDPFVTVLSSADVELELPCTYASNSAFARFVIRTANMSRQTLLEI
jgi:hypothetical protein